MNLKVVRIIALITFIGLTIMFGLYIFAGESYGYSGISFGFIVLAFFSNLLLFVLLVINMVRNKEKRRQIAKTTLVLLINIPIAILYVFLINCWDNTLRLTITNKHDTAITNVEISGSVSRSFSEIKAHAEKTIWVYNPDFCELKINYKEKGVSKSELIGNSIRGGGKASWGMGDGAISNGDMGCFNEPKVNSLHLTKQYVILNKTPI